MVRRLAIALIALVSLIVGGVIVYFAMTIPNDVKAEALMRDARGHLNKKNHKAARESYEKVIRDYPRTDAASQSLAAVLRMDADARAEAAAKVTALERALAEQKTKTASLEKRLSEVANRPVAVAPAPTPPPAKPTVRRAPAKKKAPTKKKRTTTRRRR